MHKSALEVLNTWVAGVNRGDIETVVNLYHDRAVLLPTFSDRILADRSAIHDYFKTITQRSSIKVDLYPATVHSQCHDNHIEDIMGFYHWRLEGEKETQNIEARFTMIFNLALETPLLHHHSSLVPHPLN